MLGRPSLHPRADPIASEEGGSRGGAPQAPQYKSRRHTTTTSKLTTLWEGDGNLYGSLSEPILIITLTYIRLLLRVWIKVVDEWQISYVYVRRSNVYVRGYLDLRAWSLRLRA